jgi:hypothetical protein
MFAPIRLRHVTASFLVEGKRHGVEHERLGGPEIDLQARRDGQALQRFFGRKRLLGIARGEFVLSAGERRQDGEAEENVREAHGGGSSGETMTRIVRRCAGA